MSAFLNQEKILPKENRAEPAGFQIYPMLCRGSMGILSK